MKRKVLPLLLIGWLINNSIVVSTSGTSSHPETIGRYNEDIAVGIVAGLTVVGFLSAGYMFYSNYCLQEELRCQKKNLDNLKSAASEQEKALKDKIGSLKNKRIALKNEISSLKANLQNYNDIKWHFHRTHPGLQHLSATQINTSIINFITQTHSLVQIDSQGQVVLKNNCNAYGKEDEE